MVFWAGDWNYRISETKNRIVEATEKGELENLLSKDQLTNNKNLGFIAQGFTEGKIQFAPTYKYERFSTEYSKSKKNRSPAWTDRIL